MQVKLIEIRDRGTFIPAIAVSLNPRDHQEDWLMGRAGYGLDRSKILLTDLTAGRRAEVDPSNWKDRTWYNVHLYLETQWNSVESGDVVDVEYLLGETKEPKKSELIEAEESIEERAHVDE